MSETVFSFRVDSELKAEFADAAKALDRNSSQLLRDYMRSFIEDYRVREAVRTGRDAIKKGEVIPHEEVEASFAEKKKKGRKKLKKAQSRN